MSSTTLRRLAKDQASLRRSTPPNYLFPECDDGGTLPDDLTQLTILLTGAHGTPYSQGLWRLNLKMPDDYPKMPPKATFKTRIYHPNVEESTGAVCLDTLKKDWESTLTLRDILVTISCLLIHPNPDSALNAAAGRLLQDDYEAFAKQAKLMTSIHAPIPAGMKSAVLEAKHRGEEGLGPMKEEVETRPAAVRASSSSSSVVMKKARASTLLRHISIPPTESLDTPSASDDDDHQDESKENDPSQSPSPVSFPPSSPRKNILGKRPLSELPTPTDPEVDDPFDGENINAMTSSESNILAGQILKPTHDHSTQPVRKSPKLDKSVQPRDQIRDSGFVQVYEDRSISSSSEVRGLEDEKENACKVTKTETPALGSTKANAATQAPVRPTLRKVSNIGSTRGKGPARVGIRRL